ncbi:hypothetical protein QWZ13_11055 [Reinekea marina]|nr:hypothetical protein [Reinekea marina]MDN3649451.1 hypothetical protein [Reinekea marina]
MSHRCIYILHQYCHHFHNQYFHLVSYSQHRIDRYKILRNLGNNHRQRL